MEVLILAVLIGLIPAAIAQSKGRNFVVWWLYGALLFIIALPHSLLMTKDRSELERKSLAEGMKKCPECAELIQGEARKCRFCGANLIPDRIPTELRCWHCAQMNKNNAAVCIKCGNSLL